MFESHVEYLRKCLNRFKSLKLSAVDFVVVAAVFVGQLSCHLNPRLIFSKISHLWQEESLIIAEVLQILRNSRSF